MFLTALLILIVILVLWAVLIYIRKTMWDAVHRNLLDLEDAYEGKVIRRSFASRPVFQGTFMDAALTINFSSERNRNDRRNYIDISYEKTCPVSLTISNRQWLESQETDEKPKEFETVYNHGGTAFLLMPASQTVVKQLQETDAFINCLDEMDDLSYIFFGKTGVICEFRSEQVIPDTKFDIMEKRLHLLNRLINLIKNESR